MNNIELRGDWRKLRHKVDRYSRLGEKLSREIMEDLAEEVRLALHEAVNSSPPPPNAESTAKRKGHNTPLLETGGFQEDNSIVVNQAFEGDRITYKVMGNPDKIHSRTKLSYDKVMGNPDKTHSRTKLSYDKILGILNDGGGNIPPRPVVDITYDRMTPKIKKVAVMKVREYLYE